MSKNYSDLKKKNWETSSKPSEQYEPEDFKPIKYDPENLPNLWDKLKKGGAEIENIEAEEINLTSGEHYYIIDDLRTRSVKCISCIKKHGGILESHLLTRYKVENGIIYLDGKATTKAPAGFTPPVS